ncbi:MAG TPA: hypothetical protein VKP67_27320 [Xanthobacteraceae bacterium]|nr:hypothetical protein [Xanthobacteraceae bacterium]
MSREIETGILAIFASFALNRFGSAQDLGPQVKKLADSIASHTEAQHLSASCHRD